MPYTMHLVSHTHWDREWYLTFQQFRMKLVDLMDHLFVLLERDPDFRSFHLDSQTIVLEDYLEIRPYNRLRLEQYILEGRIVVGPWYQLNDEFLTSGEATIRSLLVGSRIARQFGACALVGYLPDQFGNISQMPQIFRGFGIDNAVFGRGFQLVGDRKMEFTWESPDGSQVTASMMRYWYNNAQHVPADPDAGLGYIERLRDKMAPYSLVSHLLLMNGVDHLEAQEDLSANLAQVQARLPQGDRIVHATLEAYIAALKEEVAARGIVLEKFRGELREDRNGLILAGTLSTRMYIKQANHQAQITLEKLAEPFASFAMQAGNPYPQDFLRFAWKLLMQNHPHDSICGCSIDQVHREMMPRFAQVVQIGEDLTARSLQAIADRVSLSAGGPRPESGPGETGLVVFNSLNWVRTDPVQATLVYPLGAVTRGNPPRDDSRQAAGIALFDGDGAQILCAITDSVVKMVPVLSPVQLPLDQWVQELSIEFVAQDVPACGYKAYRVVPIPVMPAAEPWKSTEVLGWQPVYEDCGDVGDEYLYRKPDIDTCLELPAFSTTPVEDSSAVRHTLTYSTAWALPLSAAEDDQSRSVERLDCPITTQVTRWRGIPRTEYVTRFSNRVHDHRMRVVFRHQDEGFQPEPQSIAEGQFDVLYRPLVHPHESEGASPFHPQQNWVALMGMPAGSSERQTVTVINMGLPEYEIYSQQAGPGIALTLLRSVHLLSRRDDGPAFETPEAQCLGEHSFHYALTESGGSWLAGRVWQQAYQFNVPLRAVQTVIEQQAERNLPLSFSMITLEPDQLVVSAIKRAEDDPGLLIVRLFNINEAPVANGQITVFNASSAHLANLNEEVQQALHMQSGGVVTLPTIRPKEIVTLAFRME